jgi:mRNA-degrading endonuclease RelE of RelBE toxin-antitoxin system
MKILAYERFRKSYQHLPANIQQKVNKQLELLVQDLRHPSLQVKRIQGTKGIWEARVDLHYRMTFEMIGDTIYLRVVGDHDEALRHP